MLSESLKNQAKNELLYLKEGHFEGEFLEKLSAQAKLSKKEFKELLGGLSDIFLT